MGPVETREVDCAANPTDPTCTCGSAGGGSGGGASDPDTAAVSAAASSLDILPALAAGDSPSAVARALSLPATGARSDAVSAASALLALDPTPNNLLSEVREAFALPVLGACGVAVAWRSNSSALDVSHPGLAHPLRAIGHDSPATLTATLSRGAAKVERSFAVSVAAWGLRAAQFEELVLTISGLYQTGGLAFEVQRAMDRVAANPSLVANATVRAAFLAQNAAAAAAQMCTTVARYAYVRAFGVLQPDGVKGAPSFPDFYVHAVDRGYVGTCTNCASRRTSDLTCGNGAGAGSGSGSGSGNGAGAGSGSGVGGLATTSDHTRRACQVQPCRLPVARLESSLLAGLSRCRSSARVKRSSPQAVGQGGRWAAGGAVGLRTATLAPERV